MKAKHFSSCALFLSAARACFYSSHNTRVCTDFLVTTTLCAAWIFQLDFFTTVSAGFCTVILRVQVKVAPIWQFSAVHKCHGRWHDEENLTHWRPAASCYAACAACPESARLQSVEVSGWSTYWAPEAPSGSVTTHELSSPSISSRWRWAWKGLFGASFYTLCAKCLQRFFLRQYI